MRLMQSSSWMMMHHCVSILRVFPSVHFRIMESLSHARELCACVKEDFKIEKRVSNGSRAVRSRIDAQRERGWRTDVATNNIKRLLLKQQ